MGAGGIWEFIGNMIGGGAGVAGAEAAYYGTQRSLDMAQQTSDEEQRRLKLEQDRILGQTQTRAAASGFAMESATITNYLATMKAEMERQAAWTRRARETEISEAHTAADWKLAGSAISFILGSGASLGQAYAQNEGKDGGATRIDSSYDKVWSSMQSPEQTGSGGGGGGSALGDFSINGGGSAFA
jgi:hypothetical protein